MPFSRPTLPELIERVSTDIASRLPGISTAVLRRSLAGVLARAEAGAVHSLYGYLDFIARQAIPDTAEDEYLLRWVAIWLPNGRKAATYASGNRAVRVTGQVNSVLPQGTVFQRADGAQFEATESVALTGSTTATVSVRALTPGATANTVAGIQLTLLQPVAGFSSTALVVSPGIIGGTDIESLTALRARLIKRIQQPPQGGSESDYETWALEVPGVTRAWVYPRQMGAGTVTVLIASDTATTAPVPDAAVVAAAQAYIEERRPVTAEVYVLGVTTYPVDLDISLDPNTLTTQAAVRAEMDDLFLREGKPGGTIPLSKIREATSVATGVEDSRVNSPSANVTAPTGAIPVPGQYTFGSL